MPGGDRTGPMGAGPMTGRGAGYCGGSTAPGFANRLFGGGLFGRGRGGGWGGGRGGGRGWRNMFYATGLPGWARVGLGAAGAAMAAGAARAATREQQAVTREQEIEALRQQAEQAATALESLRQRLSELEGEADE